VYVSSTPIKGGSSQINGYSAASNGSLTAIPGSPFPDNVSYMAVNGAWLFGGVQGSGAEYVLSYSIGSNGALTKKDTYTVPNNEAPVSLWLDHTGATLYVDGNDGVQNDFYALSIDQSTGALSEVSDLNQGPADYSPASFIGDNEFAYSSWFYEFGGGILGLQRAGDGALSEINNFSAPIPTPPSGDGYWPTGAAANPTNNLAIALEPFKATSTGFEQAGPFQLATYTAASDGSLTTNSTYENMPKVLAAPSSGSVNSAPSLYFWMSPDGKYLAVGGALGLQIFHFNGANPITKYTGLLLSGTQIDQMFWDNANHLYAISRSAGKLYVYTVTSTSVTQAPGSPHTITSPKNIIVLPKS
jgi:hypothetical protein